jgi:hypothetical protein
LQAYLLEDLKRDLGLDRADLIALAYLLGSDYCDGVKGVGIVNAMEIIDIFGSRTVSPKITSATASMDIEPTSAVAPMLAQVLSGLTAFRDWLEEDRARGLLARPGAPSGAALLASARAEEEEEESTGAAEREKEVAQVGHHHHITLLHSHHHHIRLASSYYTALILLHIRNRSRRNIAVPRASGQLTLRFQIERWGRPTYNQRCAPMTNGHN